MDYSPATTTTIQDVINFVWSRIEADNESRFRKWDKYKVGCYIVECIQSKTIRLAHIQGKIVGVIIFNPCRQGNFWVDQIWGDYKTALAAFLEALKNEYPEVKEILGYRNKPRRRIVRFKVKTLNKLLWAAILQHHQ